MLVQINESHRATDAALWCVANNIEYTLEYWGWPGATKYRFRFDNEQDGVNFSLKWA